MSGALAEALVAAQRRTLAAMEKFYVAGAIDADQAKALMESIGLADEVDQARLLLALDFIRDTGAQLPAEPKPAANGDAEPAKATAAQVAFAQNLFTRAQVEPLDTRDLQNMPRERISALIEALKAGTYAPSEWEIPF